MLLYYMHELCILQHIILSFYVWAICRVNTLKHIDAQMVQELRFSPTGQSMKFNAVHAVKRHLSMLRWRHPAVQSLFLLISNLITIWW